MAVDMPKNSYNVNSYNVRLKLYSFLYMHAKNFELTGIFAFEIANFRA